VKHLKLGKQILTELALLKHAGQTLSIALSASAAHGGIEARMKRSAG